MKGRTLGHGQVQQNQVYFKVSQSILSPFLFFVFHSFVKGWGYGRFPKHCLKGLMELTPVEIVKIKEPKCMH